MNSSEFREDSYSGVNAIVLGAAGFIGRWVARRLSEQGADLHLIVRDGESARAIFSKYSINGDIIELDLTDFDAVDAMFNQVRPSITFNAAGYGVDHSERDEEMSHTVNVHVLEVVCRSLTKHRDEGWHGQDIVHIGSSGEYGLTTGNYSEDSSANPTTVYGKSKLAATQSLTRFCKTEGIKGLTGRPFMVYGPGEHGKRLLPSLLETARSRKPMEMTSGLQKRDFVYVDDIAEGLLRLGISKADAGDIVNLATGQLNSVKRFVQTAAMIFDIPSDCLKFGAIPMREGESEWNMEDTPVTNERLQKLTGWKPATGIAEGLQKTLEFENNGSTR